MRIEFSFKFIRCTSGAASYIAAVADAPATLLTISLSSLRWPCDIAPAGAVVTLSASVGAVPVADVGCAACGALPLPPRRDVSFCSSDAAAIDAAAASAAVAPDGILEN